MLKKILALTLAVVIALACTAVFAEEVGEDTTYWVFTDNGKELNVRRDDIVEVVPTDNRIMNESRIAYVLPVIGLLVGFFATSSKTTPERILSAVLLGIMMLIVAWVMNRVKKIVRSSPHVL